MESAQSLVVLLLTVSLALLVLSDSTAAAPHHQHHHHEHRHHQRSRNSAFQNEDVANFVRDREHLPEHRPLCQSSSTRVDLNETGFEFRPPFYYSEVCASAALQSHHSHRRSSSTAQPSCFTYGLSCVQRFRTIMIAKRIKGSSCWTTFTRNILSGCECMQPVNDYSDLRHRPL